MALLSIWLGFSLTRTIYNFSKLFTEETDWYFLTTEQKKEKQFGEKHLFLRFVQNYVPENSNVLLYTNDGMVYYLARYYLYPTIVIRGETQFSEWGNDINRDYNYVIYFPENKKTFQDQITINNTSYRKINEFKYSNTLRGVIYKK